MNNKMIWTQFFLSIHILAGVESVWAASGGGALVPPSVPAVSAGNPFKAERHDAENDFAATVSGQIMIGDKIPMADGVLLLYEKSMGPPPSQDKYWRVPDATFPLDSEGRFSIEVPEGTFYLTAAQKKADSELGPPKNSEFYYFHADGAGNPLPLTATPGSKINLGVLDGAYLWSPEMIKRDAGVTEIEGIVVDILGKPVVGALVFAYLSKNITGRPVFISERTDHNGQYRLRVHDGGTFYLKVRSVYGGGIPETGEFLNITGEFKPFSVTLKKDQKLRGVNLSVKRFPKRGPKSSDK